METREWNCVTQCEMWGVPLVCLFHNPISVSIVAPLELGLGIHNPRFARSSGRQKRKPVPILLQMCFLRLFIAVRVRIVHQRPLCIWSVSTKLLTQKHPYAQLPSRIPQGDPAKLFLLISSEVPRATHVAVLQCLTAIVINSLQPCIPAQNFTHFLRVSQSAKSVPSF